MIKREHKQHSLLEILSIPSVHGVVCSEILPGIVDFCFEISQAEDSPDLYIHVLAANRLKAIEQLTPQRFGRNVSQAYLVFPLSPISDPKVMFHTGYLSGKLEEDAGLATILDILQQPDGFSMPVYNCIDFKTDDFVRKIAQLPHVDHITATLNNSDNTIHYGIHIDALCPGYSHIVMSQLAFGDDSDRYVEIRQMTPLMSASRILVLPDNVFSTCVDFIMRMLRDQPDAAPAQEKGVTICN